MSHVFVIQNVSTKQILTWNGSSNSVTMGDVKTTNANNFHLAHQGGTITQPHYHIQRVNNHNQKLQPASGSSTVCIQSIPTSSADTIWMAEFGVNGDPLSGIKLFTMNGGDKWYLRAHAFGDSAEVVCPDHLNHPGYDEDELKFDLISANVTQ